MSQPGRPRTSKPSAPVDVARATAWRVLRGVDAEDAYANLLLPAELRRIHAAPQDSAFATELTYGTLRWRGLYDAILSRCVDRPLERLDPAVLDVLRLGAHQLFTLATPTHAAVSTSVDLVRSVVGPAPSGLVNAVMRKLSARSLNDWLGQVAPDDSVSSLAVRYSHPEWVVERFAALVSSTEELRALLEADNRAPVVSLVARPGRCTVADLLAEGGAPGRYSPVAITWPSGDPGRLTQVASGAAGVQDEGSQLVTLALLAVTVDTADRRWLDLCAGPGGKAALLGAAGVTRGARLTAVEFHPHRADLIRSVVTPNVEVVVADGTDSRWGSADYDRVLVDAPCSGLGALRRRPESRWRKSPEDLSTLIPLQRGLLSTALDAVAVGGVVAYVTCSPLVEETTEVIDFVLRDRPQIERVDARPFLPGVPHLGDGPDVQLWPHLHDTDAMFLSLLRRVR